MRRHRPVEIVSAVLLLGACLAGTRGPGPASAQGVTSFIDVSPHRSAFARVNGVRLNYLDWGGDGPPLVLVHGFGDDPHIFDDLALLLADRFRVVAYARRGHGRSEAPPGPYDAATLVEDLRHLLDHLGIQRANLLGWSMGGDEITAYAGRYPQRVDRVVYLEAGYDWSTPAFFKAFGDVLAVNGPGASDLRSLDAFRTWYRTAWLGDTQWTNGLEAYLRDLAQPDAGGTLHPVPAGKVLAALFATLGTWGRDYTKVQAPALALYGTTFFPTQRSDAASARKLREFDENTMVPFRRASMERIQRELGGVKVQQIPDRTHMSIGVEQLNALAATIREFLLAPPVR